MKQEIAITFGYLRDIIAIKFLMLAMKIMHDENAKTTIALVNHQIFSSALKGNQK